MRVTLPAPVLDGQTPKFNRYGQMLLTKNQQQYLLDNGLEADYMIQCMQDNQSLDADPFYNPEAAKIQTLRSLGYTGSRLLVVLEEIRQAEVRQEADNQARQKWVAQQQKALDKIRKARKLAGLPPLNATSPEIVAYNQALVNYRSNAGLN